MRSILPDEIEKSRITEGEYGTARGSGPYGAFQLGHLRIIACGSKFRETEGWEHVSVSVGSRCPTWGEMCLVKDLFWTEKECVVQFHPPKSHYVNHHPYCLHLWRHAASSFVLPPTILVGPK